MTALKGRAVETYLTRLEPAAAVVLIYGPDHGLVGERGRMIVKRVLGEAADDPFQACVLSGEALAKEPERLPDELYSVPMFGGRKVVRARGAGDALAPAVKSILKLPPREAMLILEAGDLKKDSALRKLIEAAPEAVAIPCYRDGDADVSRLIDQELAAIGAKATPEARALLIDLLGGDRAATRAELQKLALYAMGQASVSDRDVLAVLGDASGVETDDLIDAMLENRPNDAAAAYRRLVTSGSDPSTIAGAALRRLDFLIRLAGKMEGGASLEAALSSAKPPLFFKRRDAAAQALRRWPRPALSDAAERMQDAVLATRRQPLLGVILVERAMLALASRKP